MRYWLKQDTGRKAVSTLLRLRPDSIISSINVIYAGIFLINMTGVFRLN